MSAFDLAVTKAEGLSRLACRLGYSVQRVNNWRHRGIPAEEIFNVADAIDVDPRMLASLNKSLARESNPEA